MEKRISECLIGKEGSYILPFFWQHGESFELLTREIDAIQSCGIREFCVESRPYEDFCKDKWWTDFGFILEEAKKRDMRVWLLDDRSYPTGFANWEIRDKYPQLRKKLIRETYIDVSGPRKSTAILANRFNPKTEQLLEIVAYKRGGQDDTLVGEPIYLTALLADELVYFDIPDGIWRVFFYIRTEPTHLPYSIDMLSKESCNVMLEAVYKPHYEHFKEYFGNTFAGFFSDEPSFGNSGGDFEAKLGTNMPLPWREDLVALIAKESGKSEKEIIGLLPALWHPIERKTAFMRTYYMDVITKLYRENFSFALANWCHKHNVLYIGHVIEDMNIHMRLSHGSGHYFRALEGQDMGGVDIVLHQILPGMTELSYYSISWGGKNYEPEFYIYTLCKLASSHSHIQPLKKGRAMCEIFGAFGWVEGLPMMKHLTDHALVNGINYYVPHAFSPKVPDGDCPPHFYLGGNNPQFKLFGSLMKYMQRMCHVLEGGMHKASVAVFYNAESEWAGGEYMLFQKIAKILTQNQIDFDFVPEDVLYEASTIIENNKLHINGETYEALIISYSPILPIKLLNIFYSLATKGLPVVFADALAAASAEGEDISTLNKAFTAISLCELPSYLRSKDIFDIAVDGEQPYLRFYHYKREQNDIFMFFNEDVYNDLDTIVTMPVSGEYIVYDAFENTVSRSVTAGNKLHLKLFAGNSILICFGDTIDKTIPLFKELDAKGKELNLMFDIQLRAMGEENFQTYAAHSPLINISDANHLPRFCGEIRYTTILKGDAHYTILNLGDVGEIAELFINGNYCGAKIGHPYIFNIEGKLKQGENHIQIDVVNNLAYTNRDMLSTYYALPPSGILGPITIV